MIRESRTEDINSIMKIWLTANRQAHSFVPETFWLEHYAEVEEAISEGVMVYEEKGEVLGFLGLRENYISGLFVKEGRRSEGIGEKLLDYVKEQKERLELDVFQDNQQALKFYLREDFQIISKISDKATGCFEYHMAWKDKSEGRMTS